MADKVNKQSLVSKSKAVAEKQDFLGQAEKDDSLAVALYNQFQEFHSLDRVPDSKHLEAILLAQKEHDLQQISARKNYPALPKFSPSGAGKCEYELWQSIHGNKVPPLELQPYHRRWLRNATFVHEATQRDLIYMGKVLDSPRFTVKMLENGLPAWERNIHTYKEFNHAGQKFIMSGMCDGLLEDSETGETVIFEFKTKSTTLAMVGDYKMRDIQDAHKLQAICYSIMFLGDPYEDRDDVALLMYESLAKPQWSAGETAKTDFRTFQQNITLKDRMGILDKFAYVCSLKEAPEHEQGCMNFFCPYKEEQ